MKKYWTFLIILFLDTHFPRQFFVKEKKKDLFEEDVIGKP